MELFTAGRDYYSGYQMPLWYTSQEIFLPDQGVGTRFRLVLVKEGTGILRLGHCRISFLAPSLFCLNETEAPELEQSLSLQAEAFYFHPGIINGAFTFENIRDNTFSTVSESQDVFWLLPFLVRNVTHNSLLPLGPLSTQRVASLFHVASQELAVQRDDTWPCRSRSFFLELLFLVERIFSAPQVAERHILPESPCDIDAIILYLHAHYREKITLTQLAAAFHTNRTTLTERFRKATGVPVISYLNQLRVRMAALMLRDTELPVVEVMERVGYNDSTHFGRMFKKYTEHSPSEYRQHFCWMLH
jgi:AraC-like DNA-binding protein